MPIFKIRNVSQSKKEDRFLYILEYNIAFLPPYAKGNPAISRHTFRFILSLFQNTKTMLVLRSMLLRPLLQFALAFKIH